ncbi:TOBE domain-containing protein [Streptomyces sp. NPDC085927]|uniref:TOBE domain-containing protein n=1 Tax=Streptomyces sp. NPDC085927 TaxID=3365738 RepID=UPI0037CEDDBF
MPDQPPDRPRPRADTKDTRPTAGTTRTTAAAELGLHPGAWVWATLKAAQTHACPVRPGRNRIGRSPP